MVFTPRDGWRPETLTAVEAVAQALDLARAGLRERKVTVKSGRDIVTTTDVAVERHLRDHLAIVGHPVIGEEEGGDTPGPGSAHWLVDPICGTRNYASGTPLWCTNVALVEDGDVGVAVVGDPSTEEILVAERGGGAWALTTDGRSRRLQVRSESHTVIVEDGRASGTDRAWSGAFSAAVISADRWDFRCLSSTLSSAWLASGRVAAYVCFYLTPLHGAAGVHVAREAGATVEDLHGQPWTMDARSLVAAATADIHAEARALLEATRPD